MKKSWIAAACAVLVSTVASASTWNVTYADMPKHDLMGPLPPETISVIFTGSDANHDGVLSVDELSALSFQPVLPPPSVPGSFHVYPIQTNDTELGTPVSSSLTRFSFSLADRRLTDINAFGLESGFGANGLSFDGKQFSYISNGGEFWWDATQARVSVAEVPEPATLPLAAFGLLGIAAAARRRRG